MLGLHIVSKIRKVEQEVADEKSEALSYHVQLVLLTVPERPCFYQESSEAKAGTSE